MTLLCGMLDFTFSYHMEILLKLNYNIELFKQFVNLVYLILPDI